MRTAATRRKRWLSRIRLAAIIRSTGPSFAGGGVGSTSVAVSA